MDIVNEKAIELVKDYRDYLEFVFERDKNYYTPSQKSYSIWITNDVINLLRQNSEIPPLQIIERFRDKIERFSRQNRNTENIFTVALENIDNILDHLM